MASVILDLKLGFSVKGTGSDVWKPEVQSQETEQETIMPKDDTGDEDANKVMTLQDDRVLGTFPLQAREKKLEALDRLQTLTGEGRKLQAEQLMESQAAGLAEDRELAKQDARIKFLMGLSKGKIIF